MNRQLQKLKIHQLDMQGHILLDMQGHIPPSVQGTQTTFCATQHVMRYISKYIIFLFQIVCHSIFLSISLTFRHNLQNKERKLTFILLAHLSIQMTEKEAQKVNIPWSYSNLMFSLATLFNWKTKYNKYRIEIDCNIIYIGGE